MYSISSPTQARSKKALERFLNVAAELLADNRFEDTGISQIAVLAESSVGTFYRLLGDKDVLLYAVHERFVEQGRSAIDSLVQDLGHSELPLSGQIEAFIQGIIALFEGREGLLRALVRRSSLRHPQPQQAADLAAHMLLASLNYLTMVGTLGETPREVIPEELSRLICNYLEVAKH